MNRAYALLNITKATDGDGDRVIEGIASTPTTDRVGDIVEPLGAQFKLPLPLLWQHRADMPIGHVEFAKPTKDGIPFRARIAEKGLLGWIDEAWTLIKAGLVRGVSIGFKPVESADIDGTWGVRFTKWEWLELSAVTIPANAEATITSIKQFDDAAIKQRQQAATGHKAGRDSGRSASGVKPPGDTGPKHSKGNRMKTIQEQIAAFDTKRAANTDRMTAIMSKASDEGRTLDEAETEEYDELQAEVRSIDEHVTRLREHESMIATRATPVTPAAATNPEVATQQRGGTGVVAVRSNEPKGWAFTKYAMLLASSKGNLVQAWEMSKGLNDPRLEQVFKAAVTAGTTTDASWAAPLIPYNDMVSEFIDLLRPQTIVGRVSGWRRVPFNVRMPRQTAGASAGWVGQGAPKPVGSMTFDTVSLPWAKIAVIIALTEELVRFSNPSAVAVCQQDMVDTISTFMDEQFVDPTVAVSANVSPASILNGVTATPSTGSTVAAITTDVQTLLQRFAAVNHTPRAPHWIMNPRTALYLSLLRTSQDIFAFPNVTMNGGTWFGMPVITSGSVSLDYGSPTATYIALVDAAEVLLADDGMVTLDVSREASIQLDDAPSAGAQSLVSLWQNNLIGLRAERYITWLKRRASAAYFIDGVTY